MEFKLFSAGVQNALSKRQEKEEILETNEESIEYGLVLSEQDTAMLIKAGETALQEQERIAFGENLTPKLIRKFMKSSYLWQGNYAETMAELLSVFYYVKEETWDFVADDVILEQMYQSFEGSCGGSVALLLNRDMAIFCKQVQQTASGISEEEPTCETEEEEW